MAVFGNTSSDTTSYAIGTVDSNTVISSAKFTELMNRVNDERARRGVGAAAQPSYTDNSSKVEASDLNAIKSAVEVTPTALGTAGYLDRHGYQTNSSYQDANNVTQYFSQGGAYTAGFAGVSATGTMYAQNVNDMITKINAAAAVCMCNCNYCTCNCNYCTCNCNYACTCHCNYSDERVKTDIEYM